MVKQPYPFWQALGQFMDNHRSGALEDAIKSIEAVRKRAIASMVPCHGISSANQYDMGLPFKAIESKPVPLGEVARRACKRPVWCRLLYTLVEQLQPHCVLELGSCVGISTSYLASALPNGSKLYSLEGSSDFHRIARLHLEELRLDARCELITGLFQDTLPTLLDGRSRFDLIFVDGHHDGKATVEYFDQLKPYCSATATFVFDDIDWSDGMREAWKHIKVDPLVAAAADFREIGLVCLNHQPIGRAHFDINVCMRVD
jgi:predicted O-methyltransferase YrrM